MTDIRVSGLDHATTDAIGASALLLRSEHQPTPLPDHPEATDQQRVAFLRDLLDDVENSNRHRTAGRPTAEGTPTGSEDDPHQPEHRSVTWTVYVQWLPTNDLPTRETVDIRPDWLTARRFGLRMACLAGVRYVTVTGPDGWVVGDWDRYSNRWRTYPRTISAVTGATR